MNTGLVEDRLELDADRIGRHPLRAGNGLYRFPLHKKAHDLRLSWREVEEAHEKMLVGRPCAETGCQKKG